ncbi:SgcJ/EcaC family oxidoreductase [Sphaerisporangium perillae]|uniref:SgcJ/EcaC family oxidoreductase n=1 Tax=Sphaerisporangium perillae TaxID=2935860 RepID=UPI00200E91BE|nr:SgcJ/EcaC family oxidoreductase [Sphaerisporangium perillae]
MGMQRQLRRTIGLTLITGLGMALIGAATPMASIAPAADAVAPGGSRTPWADHAESDLAALRHIWEREAVAWARGDAAAYAAAYTRDADLVNIRGEHLRTRDGIASRIQYYFDNQLKKTRLLRLEERVRFVSPTMAIIVRKDCVLYGTETACRPDTLSLNTSVAVKHDGRWMITSFHNTLVRR